MQLWFILTILALFFWGLWGFCSKLAVSNVEPKSALIYEIIGELIILGFVLLVIKFPTSSNISNNIVGIFAGIALILGMLTFFMALKHGESSLVVPLTALYPVIAIILGFLFLDERINFIQGVGISFALVAAYLLGDSNEE